MNNHVMLIGRINNDIEKIEMDDKLTYKLMLNITFYDSINRTNTWTLLHFFIEINVFKTK